MNRSGLVRFVEFLTVILELSIFVRSTSRTGKQRPVLRSTSGSLRDILAEDSPLSNFGWGRKSRASKRSAVPKEGQLAVSETTANPQSTGWLEMTARVAFNHIQCTGKFDLKKGGLKRTQLVLIGYRERGSSGDKTGFSCHILDPADSQTDVSTIEFGRDPGSEFDFLFTGHTLSLVKSSRALHPEIMTDQSGDPLVIVGLYQGAGFLLSSVPVDRMNFPRPFGVTTETEIILMDRFVYPIFHCYTKRRLNRGMHVLGRRSLQQGDFLPACFTHDWKDCDEWTPESPLAIEWTPESTTKLIEIAKKLNSEEMELTVNILDHKSLTFRTLYDCNFSRSATGNKRTSTLTCNSDKRTKTRHFELPQ